MAKKTITLETKDTKTLFQLLFRGLCYTDAYYRDSVKMDKVFDEVVRQLKAQGAKEVCEDFIKFK